MKPFPDAVRAFISDAQICRIATVRPDGIPHIIPVCPVFDGERLYVDIDPDGMSARGVRANGRVTVLIDEYDDDWTRLRAVVLRTAAEALEGDAQESAFAMIREKFPQYSSVNWEPRLTLALDIAGWTQWGVVS